MEQAMPRLTKNDLTRYERQILYSDFGEKGQERLKQSHVLVAGLGGLGCAASLYLTCSGIGHIRLIDCDRVELSNLNRQILHCEEDIGERKPFSAAQKLARLNSDIEVTPVFKKISERNARGIIRGVDLVIDGMDNFKTRFILNEACVAEGIPFIHGGVHGLFGEITTIIPGRTPCLACIFPEVPQRKEALPVFGVTPALIAILQVTEAIKLLAGFGSLVAGKMLYVNGETMDFTFRNLVRNQNCRVCGTRKAQK
jgi:molybdopterin/thiamine biosynthesis adenylyltransferase